MREHIIIFFFLLTTGLSALDVQEFQHNLDLLLKNAPELVEDDKAYSYFGGEFNAYIEGMSRKEVLTFFFEKADLSKWDGFEIESRVWENDLTLFIGLFVDDISNPYEGHWQTIAITFYSKGNTRVNCLKSHGWNLKAPPPPPENTVINKDKTKQEEEEATDN